MLQAELSSSGRRLELLDPVDSLQQDMWAGGAEEDQDLHQPSCSSRRSGVLRREVPDQQVLSQTVSRGQLQS